MKPKHKNNSYIYKLIALDIDGTLLTSDYTISNHTKSVLKAAMNQGILVTIATGRFHLSAIRIAKEIGINAPMVCNDGALIKDILTDKTVFKKQLSMNISLEILDLITKYKTIKAQVFMEDYRIYIGSYFKKMQFKRFINSLRRKPFRNCFNYYRDFIRPAAVDAENLSVAKDMIKSPPLKIVLCGDENEIEDLKIELKEKYNNNIFLTTAIKNWIDIIHGDISKAKGLAILAEKLGIKRDEIIAIGDNINDIPMLKFAGLGVAMGNAPDRVKKESDTVTLSNDKDGVAKFLESIIKLY